MSNFLPLPSIPVIFGCEGPRLSEAERVFFRKYNPVGLILFTRNCETPDQVRELISDFKKSVTVPEPLILIDQEGGRVQRLTAPNWPVYPAAGKVAELASINLDKGEKAIYLLGRLLASDLAPLGITVNCAPVLDVLRSEAHDIIGDRALGKNATQVSHLGRALCNGLLSGGVLPVIKHIPGHGRAGIDSHKALPVVNASAEELETIDFAPFRALRDMPLAMTAHAAFTVFDSLKPVTTSDILIREVLRGRIGYRGVLMSDDITMSALTGSMDERARNALLAGCDLILHCNGIMTEMRIVAGAVQKTSLILAESLVQMELLRRSALINDQFNPDQGRSQLAEMLAVSGDPM